MRASSGSAANARFIGAPGLERFPDVSMLVYFIHASLPNAANELTKTPHDSSMSEFPRRRVGDLVGAARAEARERLNKSRGAL